MIQDQMYWGTAPLAPSLEEVPPRYKGRMIDLFDTWGSLVGRNRTLSMYYNMKNQMKDMGISIPENLIHVNCAMGWCKKAIDAHVVRSTFDGYSFSGVEDAALNALARENRLAGIYKRAARASLIHGVSAISVMAGTAWQPAAKVRANSANQFSVLWDKDEDMIACGVVLADVDTKGRPTRYVAHFPDAVLVLKRRDLGILGDMWDCDVLDNDLGRPMMEVMPYDSDLDRPLGHSMITPELQGIVDKAMRDVFRMDVGAEFFTFPQRYVLGAAEDLFSAPSEADQQSGYDVADDDPEMDGEGEADEERPAPPSSDYAKFRAYIGAFLAISRDENGEIPQVGQFPASPAENFTHMFENDAQRFSGATNVPLAQLGVLSNTYTSSDALSATNDPLILEVEDINRDNARVMEEVARMMLAISGGKTMKELTPQERAVQAVFPDPSMPTRASRADAATKQGAQDVDYVGTRVYYEDLGYSKAKTDRLLREKQENGAIQSLNRIADSLQGAK